MEFMSGYNTTNAINKAAGKINNIGVLIFRDLKKETDNFFCAIIYQPAVFAIIMSLRIDWLFVLQIEEISFGNINQ